jgi:hypothetical protein
VTVNAHEIYTSQSYTHKKVVQLHIQLRLHVQLGLRINTARRVSLVYPTAPTTKLNASAYKFSPSRRKKLRPWCGAKKFRSSHIVRRSASGEMSRIQETNGQSVRTPRQFGTYPKLEWWKKSYLKTSANHIAWPLGRDGQPSTLHQMTESCAATVGAFEEPAGRSFTPQRRHQPLTCYRSLKFCGDTETYCASFCSTSSVLYVLQNKTLRK